MKKLFFLMTAAIVALSLTAAPVDQATATQKAKSYLTNELYAGRIMAPAAVNPILLKAEIGSAKLNQPAYYIYNTSTTFLVIAGDDRAEEILMVGSVSTRRKSHSSRSIPIFRFRSLHKGPLQACVP